MESWQRRVDPDKPVPRVVGLDSPDVPAVHESRKLQVAGPFAPLVESTSKFYEVHGLLRSRVRLSSLRLEHMGLRIVIDGRDPMDDGGSGQASSRRSGRCATNRALTDTEKKRNSKSAARHSISIPTVPLGVASRTVGSQQGRRREITALSSPPRRREAAGIRAGY
jgi:hypothetical protein